MKKNTKIFVAFALVLSSNVPAFSQSGMAGNRIFLYGLIGLGLLLLLWAILAVADNLMQIEADKRGINKKNNLSIFPKFKDISGKKTAAYAEPDKFHALSKGHDILLAGKIEDNNIIEKYSSKVSVSPYNYRGLAPIPKLEVEMGQNVLAGDPLFYDKNNPEIKYVSPVSGEVIELKRGAKRSISDIVILADTEQKSKEYDLPNVENRKELVDFLAASGLWNTLVQRPFDEVPKIDEVPRDIFVTTFDSAPLAPDSTVVLGPDIKAFDKGIKVLSNLTEGKVYLGLDGKLDSPSPFAATIGPKIEQHFFKGKHPVGNVGIQIHHIKPIKPNDKVWTITYQDVIRWGKLFLKGKYDGTKIYAITGDQVKETQYVKSFLGVQMSDLLKSNIKEGNNRIIAGDVLSGTKVELDDFISAKADQVTVIKEGDHYEMFGWLLPLSPRPSVSNTFPNFLFPNYEFSVDTNTHGERRAFVMTGQYEKVLPMNIYPQHLMKAIITEDFEKIEGLGIAELTEEDVAICEFVCPSKAPLQQILRDGLDFMKAQG